MFPALVIGQANLRLDDRQLAQPVIAELPPVIEHHHGAEGDAGQGYILELESIQHRPEIPRTLRDAVSAQRLARESVAAVIDGDYPAALGERVQIARPETVGGHHQAVQEHQRRPLTLLRIVDGRAILHSDRGHGASCVW